MDKPVQWMTVEELRAELERTHPAWQADIRGASLDQFVATGNQTELSPGARRHLAVRAQLDRRASED